eukprot:Blabericola_migrator_1__4587@NODE_2437_length_2760_cov_154_476792_g1526_i0_p3_GENE_NODE_2437_length_2760_cov_154_476792_g1526_i0NODE_2437_length_2760_cov_154_476792_g1526_i0_p3_ORF_typecomplete_len151_score23_27zfHIT/PF04438_16/1_8e07zfMYST/PF17772_1/1_NODE_2437_length_2760_cov_154_476792_g1526_i0241693
MKCRKAYEFLRRSMELDEEGSALKRVKYTCRVCEKGEAIYSCPKCLTRTCSVTCIQEHKAGDGCDGKRRVVEEKLLKDMDDSDLHKDVKFLEDVGGSIERQARQDNLLLAERYGISAPRAHLNVKPPEDLSSESESSESQHNMFIKQQVC